MRVLVITPPVPVITTDEAKDHLRILSDDEDMLVDALVAAATGHIDGPDGWLGRAIGLQTLEARGEMFADPCLRLPYPPVVTVSSVKYLDGDGVEQTLAPETYSVRGDRIAAVWGAAWPQVRSEPENVRVRYQAGYATVPAPIRAAILLMVGDLYQFRETAVTGTIATEIPMSTTVQALLSPYRVWA
jgi:uncharacterized phiE125 gp8 family phage protein